MAEEFKKHLDNLLLSMLEKIGDLELIQNTKMNMIY